jgi:hypothetical protein
MSKRNRSLCEALMIPLLVVMKFSQRQPTALKLALVLSLLVSAGMAECLWPPRTIAMAADSAEDSDIALIRRYYSAVNLALTTGTTGSLDAIIAIDFVEHDPEPGCEANRYGLFAGLQMLRAVAPGLRMQVLSVVAKDGLVSARVATVNVNTSSMPGQIVSPARLWADTDIFHVEGDQIVEHWRQEAGPAMLAPLISTEQVTISI